VKREDIPVRLRLARAQDIARIPDAALKTMSPADVAPRLLAAGEYRRRASVPHLDGDLYRYRLGLASEVLTTADPKRAAELVKAAGVQSPPLAAAPRALAKSVASDRQATLDDLAKAAMAAVQRRAAGLGLQIDRVALQLKGVQGTIADATGGQVAERLSKAAAYRQKAAAASTGTDRSTYLQLARELEQTAGAA
jgi:hypothetical protein